MSASHSFEFTCPTPGCGHRYRGTPELGGKTILCKDCNKKVKVPAAPASAGTALASSGAPASPARSAVAAERPPAPSAAFSSAAADRNGIAAHPDSEQVRCPGCNAECRIRPEWRGQTLECPSCKNRFVVPSATRRAARTPAAADDDVAFFTEDANEELEGYFRSRFFWIPAGFTVASILPACITGPMALGAMALAVGRAASQTPGGPPTPTVAGNQPAAQPAASSAAPAGQTADELTITLSNGKYWRRPGPAILGCECRVDFQFKWERMRGGDQYYLVLKPGRGARRTVIHLITFVIHSSGTIEGSWVPDSGDSGPYEAHMEVKRIAASPFDPGQKASNTISLVETPAPTSPSPGQGQPGLVDPASLGAAAGKGRDRAGRGGLPPPSGPPPGISTGPPGGVPRGPRGR